MRLQVKTDVTTRIDGFRLVTVRRTMMMSSTMETAQRVMKTSMTLVAATVKRGAAENNQLKFVAKEMVAAAAAVEEAAMLAAAMLIFLLFHCSFLCRSHTDRFPDDITRKLRRNRNPDSCEKTPLEQKKQESRGFLQELPA